MGVGESTGAQLRTEDTVDDSLESVESVMAAVFADEETSGGGAPPIARKCAAIKRSRRCSACARGDEEGEGDEIAAAAVFPLLPL